MPSRKQDKRAHKQVVKVNNFVSNVVECIDDWFFAARDESEKLQECAKGRGGGRSNKRKKEGGSTKKREKDFFWMRRREARKQREREREGERERLVRRRELLSEQKKITRSNHTKQRLTDSSFLLL